MTSNRTFSRNPLEGSKCQGCKHLVQRVIIPFNEAEYGIDREAMDIPEDEEIIYEHYLCNETGIDLDHIVVECNLFVPKNMKGFIRKDLLD